MNISLLITGLLGLCGIILGAYADHALLPYLSVADIKSFSVALDYHQLYSVILLVLSGFYWLPVRKTGLGWLVSGFTLGILLFSGSIYLRILTGYTGLSFLTPVGGTVLILSWMGVVVFSILNKPNNAR